MSGCSRRHKKNAWAPSHDVLFWRRVRGQSLLTDGGSFAGWLSPERAGPAGDGCTGPELSSFGRVQKHLSKCFQINIELSQDVNRLAVTLREQGEQDVLRRHARFVESAGLHRRCLEDSLYRGGNRQLIRYGT
jgi:hypothetical protein